LIGREIEGLFQGILHRFLPIPGRSGVPDQNKRLRTAFPDRQPTEITFVQGPDSSALARQLRKQGRFFFRSGPSPFS